MEERVEAIGVERNTQAVTLGESFNEESGVAGGGLLYSLAPNHHLHHHCSLHDDSRRFSGRVGSRVKAYRAFGEKVAWGTGFVSPTPARLPTRVVLPTFLCRENQMTRT